MRTFRMVAVVAFGLLMAACGATKRELTVMPLDPQEEQMLRTAKAVADAPFGSQRFEGDLPAFIAPLDMKTDDLGRMQVVPVTDAIRRFGEPAVRQIAAENVRVCAKITIQKIAVVKFHRRIEHTRQNIAELKERRERNSKIATGSMIIGGIFAAVEFGSTYGVLTALTSVIPGLANQDSFDAAMAQTELMNELWADMGDFWLYQNDLWLDAMGLWCYGDGQHGGFIQWMQQHGARLVAAANDNEVLQQRAA